ncbi:hypothetical protein T484DRAFT_1855133, partial [Baffinella frigidus]
TEAAGGAAAQGGAVAEGGGGGHGWGGTQTVVVAGGGEAAGGTLGAGVGGGPAVLSPEEVAAQAGPVVHQGWIHSRENVLRGLWHRRWAVARQGRLDLYESEDVTKVVQTVPLQECRVEKLQVRDGRLQEGCDFECGIRVVLGKGLGFGKEKLLAAASPEEQNAWGGALMACRQGVLQVSQEPKKMARSISVHTSQEPKKMAKSGVHTPQEPKKKP